MAGKLEVNTLIQKNGILFPNDNKYKTTYTMLLPVHEREKRNEKAFTSVRVDTCKETTIDSGKQKEIIKRGLIVFLI